MKKTTTFFKPTTTAILLAVFVMAHDSCRKSETVSRLAPALTQSAPVSSGTTLDVSGTLQVVSIAGDGTAGYADGSGVQARFNFPGAVAIDGSGNVFIADVANHRIRKMTASGVVSTFAGNGIAGYQDGAAATAQFNAPSGVATDAAGNVYVADKNNQLIRKITPDGTVSTFAGSVGIPGSTDGPGVSAQFNFPCGVAVNASGNVLVADSANHKIRSITVDGFVSSLAGNGTRGTSDGPGPFSQFNGPTGVTADVSGNVYVADAGNNKIRKIAGGLVSTLAGGGTTGDASGFVNGSATDARFSHPSGVVADGVGNVFVSDKSNHAIRQVSASGVVTTLSGDGTAGFVDGVTTAAKFNSPAGIAMDASGKLFIADQGNQRIRRIAPRTVTVTTFAGTAGIAGRTNGAASAAQFNFPAGLTVDASGLTVAEHGNNDVRYISFSDLQVSTTVGLQGTAGYQNGFFTGALFRGPTSAVYVPSRSSLFVADRLNNSIRQRTGYYVYGYAGNPNAAGYAEGQYSNALFSAPSGIVADAAGNLYIADQNNHRIRKIDVNGFSSTLAGSGVSGSADGAGATAQFNYPYGLTIDASGNIYVADMGNHKIRKITPSGFVSTVAGNGTPGLINGPAASAQFYYPHGVAVDASGNVYVADMNNNVIRMITPSGEVSTLAGTGAVGYRDGSGNNAMFNYPIGIAVDGNGNVYVSDFYNHVIRKISIQ